MKRWHENRKIFRHLHFQFRTIRGWTLLNHEKRRRFINVHWLEDVNGHSSWQQLNEEIYPRYFSRSISSTGRAIDSWNASENYWGVGKVSRKLSSGTPLKQINVERMWEKKNARLEYFLFSPPDLWSLLLREWREKEGRKIPRYIKKWKRKRKKYMHSKRTRMNMI